MSGVEVMGLISAVISIIDISSKLYVAIENTGNLPEAFKDVARRLPLARDTLQITEERLKKSEVDGHTYTTINIIIKSCKDKAERLRDILTDLAAQPGASRIERYRLAVRRLGRESKIEELMKSLLEDVQLLAANQAVKAVGEDRIDELMVAIQELSQVPPSLPDGPVFTYHGTGDQISNTGSGIQNINKGMGDQNFAHTIYFGSRSG